MKVRRYTQQLDDEQREIMPIIFLNMKLQTWTQMYM